jgi:hypothetical protein
MREKIKTVMRYAGKRMILRHPVLALFHMFDARRTPSGKIAGAKRVYRKQP